MTIEKLNKLSGSYGKSSGKVAVIFEVKPKKEGMDELFIACDKPEIHVVANRRICKH
jgi:hypothetical protein